ncbi:MAG: DUF4160 domain-containing protein [bacterium]
MPELSRFYGIVIRMYFDDHPPPHFHAQYGSDQAIIGIDGLAVLRGKLPARALGLVMEWAALHEAELREQWRNAERLEPIRKIPPLD